MLLNISAFHILKHSMGGLRCDTAFLTKPALRDILTLVFPKEIDDLPCLFSGKPGDIKFAINRQTTAKLIPPCARLRHQT